MADVTFYITYFEGNYHLGAKVQPGSFIHVPPGFDLMARGNDPLPLHAKVGDAYEVKKASTQITHIYYGKKGAIETPNYQMRIAESGHNIRLIKGIDDSFEVSLIYEYQVGQQAVVVDFIKEIDENSRNQLTADLDIYCPTLDESFVFKGQDTFLGLNMPTLPHAKTYSFSVGGEPSQSPLWMDGEVMGSNTSDLEIKPPGTIPKKDG